MVHHLRASTVQVLDSPSTVILMFGAPGGHQTHIELSRDEAQVLYFFLGASLEEEPA